MSYYLVQASYGAAAYGAMVSHPQDRSAAVLRISAIVDGCFSLITDAVSA